MTIRAGVLIAEPFAYYALNDESQPNQQQQQQSVEPANDGKQFIGGSTTTATERSTAQLEGFQIDLMQHMQSIAKEYDGIDLQFELETSSVDSLSYNAALDFIANDCVDTADLVTSLTTGTNCSSYDMLIGDYWANPDRFARVDFTPSWLGTSISTIKAVDNLYNTMTDAVRAGEKVCIRSNSATPGIVEEAFPGVQIHSCQVDEECLQELKEGNCVLFAADELKLRYRAREDPSLEVTREQFRTQKLVWPLRRDLDTTVSYLLKRWLYLAAQDSVLDDLYVKYFDFELCPVGKSGLHCDEECDAIHGTSNRKGECVCESQRWTGADCSIEVLEELNMINPKLKAVGYAMFGINALMVAICFLWLYAKRGTAQVRVAQPLFLALVLLGCIVSSSTILAFAQEDALDGPVTACMFIPWLYSVGFCITFGTLFAKIYRVLVMFRSTITMRRSGVTAKVTLLIIGAILLIDVILLTVWTIVDPLKWTREDLTFDKFGYVLASQGYCTSHNWEIFAGTIAVLHLVLLLFASYCCYVSRGISTQFSEGKYVAIAMVSNLQIFIVGLPVLALVGSDANSAYFVRCMIIWMNDFMVVVVIFGNLIYSVHFGKQGRRMSQQRLSYRRAIQEYHDSIGKSSSSGQTRSMQSIPPTSASANAPVVPSSPEHTKAKYPNFNMPAIDESDSSQVAEDDEEQAGNTKSAPPFPEQTKTRYANFNMPAIDETSMSESKQVAEDDEGHVSALPSSSLSETARVTVTVTPSDIVEDSGASTKEADIARKRPSHTLSPTSKKYAVIGVEKMNSTAQLNKPKGFWDEWKQKNSEVGEDPPPAASNLTESSSNKESTELNSDDHQLTKPQTGFWDDWKRKNAETNEVLPPVSNEIIESGSNKEAQEVHPDDQQLKAPQEQVEDG